MSIGQIRVGASAREIVAMGISVFLSVPRPHQAKQQAFIDEITKHLGERGLETRTLGVTDYDTHAPLTAIRRMLIESNGLFAIAFRRTHVASAVLKEGADISPHEAVTKNDFWLTSPWCHIETAMAFQLGLPILVLREKGVIADGILELGVTGTYMPEFNLDDPGFGLLRNQEGRQLLAEWEGYVRHVVRTKGQPPRLYY